MRFYKSVLMLATFIPGAAFAAADGGTALTIYNQNLALVKKTADFEFKPGINEIVFDEAARQMRPESAFIYGEGVKILEQNYDYAGINYINLLNANEGKKVLTVRVNPATGENIFERAELLTAEGGMPVLKFDYGIEANFPGRVVFDNIEAGMSGTPVFKAKAEADKAGKKTLHLAYLTSGLSWEADYVVRVNDDDKLFILGRAKITNNSGSDYDNVAVSLMAGEVNAVQAVMPRFYAKTALMNAMARGDTDAMESEAVIEAPTDVNGYYVYDVPQAATLKDGQMKQVSFVTAGDVKYRKRGEIISPLQFGNVRGSFKDVHPSVIYNFENTAENGLGMPLPAGKISFYDFDGKGVLQFVGENRIDNKATGQRLTVNVGKFFDVYAEGTISAGKEKGTRTLKQKTGNGCAVYEQAYTYELKFKVANTSAKERGIVLKQRLPGQSEIVKESLKGEEGDGNEYLWRFSVAPGSEKEVTAEVLRKVETRDCNIF